MLMNKAISLLAITGLCISMTSGSFAEARINYLSHSDRKAIEKYAKVIVDSQGHATVVIGGHKTPVLDKYGLPSCLCHGKSTMFEHGRMIACCSTVSQ